jgi:hypothetical protein
LLQVLKGPNELSFLWPARTAISLHCHTHHSKEILDFIPHYAAVNPMATWRPGLGSRRRVDDRFIRHSPLAPRFAMGFVE